MLHASFKVSKEAQCKLQDLLTTGVSVQVSSKVASVEPEVGDEEGGAAEALGRWVSLALWPRGARAVAALLSLCCRSVQRLLLCDQSCCSSVAALLHVFLAG